MNSKLPKVKVAFILEGKDFDVDKITERLKVPPTSVRSKNDWPDAIKNLPENYPDNLKPRVNWILETEKEICDSVQKQFEKITKKLVGKEEIIKNLCLQYNLETGFTIVIDMEEMNRPELFLTKEIISFAASINAEIGFDLYIY